MYSTALTVGTLLLGGVAATAGSVVDPSALDACPGYTASNVKAQRASLTADLVLAGTNCSVFGADIEKLSLKVVYETGMSQHLSLLASQLIQGCARHQNSRQNHRCIQSTLRGSGVSLPASFN